MPIINVNISLKEDDAHCGQSFATLAKRLTESTVRVMKKQRELVVVRINHDTNQAKWFEHDGSNDKNKFEVTIKITKGTNTQEEISSWVRETYESVTQELGKFDGANYISVIQTEDISWGYNGLTQLARKKWSA